MSDTRPCANCGYVLPAAFVDTLCPACAIASSYRENAKLRAELAAAHLDVARMQEERAALHLHVEPKKAHQAVQHLLCAMWLYPTHTLNSRGPAGCLLDAIEALEPHTAKRLHDGDEVGDLYEREDEDE